MSDILDTEFEGYDVTLDDHRAKLGDEININSKDPALRKVHIGFGWDLSSFNADAIDLDVSVFLLDKNEKTRVDEDFVFYNNMETLGGAVKHNGDNRTGAGEGDDESLYIDLNGVPFDVTRMVFVISIYKGKEKGQNLSMARNVFLRIVNQETNIELLRFEMDEILIECQEIGIIAGYLNREGPKWHFVPANEVMPGGLSEIATRYGIIVARQ